MERGGSLKSPYLIARCIQLNTNILQGSLANIVGTEPIFVSNAELCRLKYVIINTLHFIQLLQGKLGSGFGPQADPNLFLWPKQISENYIFTLFSSLISFNLKLLIINNYIPFKTIIYVLSGNHPKLAYWLACFFPIPSC